MEGILAGIIPSQTNAINSILGKVSTTGTNSLNLNQYGTQTIPYYISGNNVTGAQYLLQNTLGSVSGANLVPVNTSDVNNYVLGLRTSNLNSFIYDYFVGLSLDYTNTTLSSTFYYSSLAFHSSACILNQISNMILISLTNDNSYSITTINSPLASNSSLSNSTSFLELLACLDTLPLSLLNFINSIIIAFVISILVMHIARERLNGSKQLQFLSGTHYLTYWISNYIFDLIVCFFIASSMVLMLKIVDLIKNDLSSETSPVAASDSLGYFYLLMLFSIFTWCSLAYAWSFLFKTDIICFIVLFIILTFLAFADTVLTFVVLIFQNSSPGSSNVGANVFSAIRIILMLLFPNITIKRGLYNLKIRANSYCISQVNNLLYSNYS